jgi:hypothetical protein
VDAVEFTFKPLQVNHSVGAWAVQDFLYILPVLQMACSSPSGPPPAAAPRPVAAQEGGAPADTQLRVAFDAPFFAASEGGAPVGLLAAGESVQVLQRINDSQGRVKIQHQRGWTPLLAPTGAVILLSVPPEGLPPAGK